MKKQITAVITAALILVNLTACSTNTEPNNNSSEISDSGNGISSPDSTDNSENTLESSDSSPEQRLSNEQLEMISKLKIQSFVGPDGETVQAADAADIFDTEATHAEIGSPGFKFDSKAISDEIEFDEDGNMIDPEIVSTVLRYDFAYIRYRRPLFYKGEMLDEAAEQKMIDELTEDKWFKIKAGDKLDCGLTVKKAVYERFPVESYVPTRDNYIEFDGEVTLEGLLFAVKNDRDYLVKMGDLTFTPDPTKTNGIPDCPQELNTDYIITRSMYSDGDFVMTDGTAAWIVGNVDDIDSDYIFGDNEQVRVKVTLSSVKYGGILSVDMPAFYAEIVDVERID